MYSQNRNKIEAVISAMSTSEDHHKAILDDEVKRHVHNVQEDPTKMLSWDYDYSARCVSNFQVARDGLAIFKSLFTQAAVDEVGFEAMLADFYSVIDSRLFECFQGTSDRLAQEGRKYAGTAWLALAVKVKRIVAHTKD
jgi:hypothetical protein